MQYGDCVTEEIGVFGEIYSFSFCFVAPPSEYVGGGYGSCVSKHLATI